MNPERMTIKDLARELGVSIATVSRALSDSWEVSEDTRRMVLEKALVMGYKPNPFSKNLRKGQSMTIGVVVPEFTHWFFPEIILGIQQVVEPEGYQVLIATSGESAHKERQNIERLVDSWVDGVLISVCSGQENADYFRQLTEQGFPLVFFDRVCSLPRVPRIVIDDRRMAFQATTHLLEQGCRRLVHLRGPESISVFEDRLAGFRDALQTVAIVFDEKQVISTGMRLQDGEQAAKKILGMNPMPDGVFSAVDEAAAGAMKALRGAGVQIPRDMAFIGFSDSPVCTLVEPALSSVSQSPLEMGLSAAKQMLGRLRDTCVEKEICVESELVLRESSLRR